MSNRIVVKQRLFIPKHLVNARRLKALYTKRFYEENKCIRCPYLGERHSEHCDGCPNFLGRLQMYREGERGGTPVYELPAGDLPTIADQLNIDLSGVRDLRKVIPFEHKLVWTGKLRRGEVVDGVATANQARIVRCWLRKRRNGIIKAPPRTGKCLTGDTYLSTSEGFLRFDERVISKGYRKTSGTVATIRGEKRVAFTYNAKARPWHVVTENGFEERGTGEHRVKVLNPDLTFSWVHLEKLTEGQYILSGGHKSEYIWPKTDKISIDEAKILGYLTANGRGSELCTGDPKVIKDYCRCIKRAFGATPYIVERRGLSYIRFSGLNKNSKYRGQSLFQALAEKSGYAGGSAATKSIPLAVRQSSKVVVCAYLNAYFACDSGKNGEALELTTASRELANQLHILLWQAFGIKGYKHNFLKSAANSSTPNLRTYYQVVLSGYAITLFKHYFPQAKASAKFISQPKTMQWATTNEYVPYVVEYFMEKIVSKLTLKGFYYTYKGQPVEKCWPWQGWRVPKRLTGLASANLDWDLIDALARRVDKVAAKRIRNLIAGGFHFEKVTTIKQQSKLVEVYDLNVPDGHSYMANGLCNHNTVMGTYLSVEIGGKTLIMTHQEELLKNFLKTYLRDTNLRSLRRRTGKPIVAIVRKDSDFEGLDVALVTYQKFIREGTGLARINKYLRGHFTTLICDEAHQSPATAYSRVINELDVRYRIALTATPIRKDGMSVLLERMFGPIQAEANSVALVPELRIWETEVRPPHAKGFKLWAYAMKHLFNSQDRNHQIVRQVFADLRAGHRCVVIPVDQIAHIKELVRLINHQAGINRQKRGENWAKQLAVELHGKSPRDAVLKAVEAGKHQVLVANRSMVKQGIDLKAPTALYIAVPMSNPAMFRQLAWRVGTPQEGKIQPIVRIMVDRMVQSSACFRSLFNTEIRANVKASDEGPASYKISVEELAKARAIAGDRQYHLRAKRTGEAPKKMGKVKGNAKPAARQSGFAHLSKSKATSVRSQTPRKHTVRMPAKMSNQLAKW